MTSLPLLFLSVHCIDCVAKFFFKTNACDRLRIIKGNACLIYKDGRVYKGKICAKQKLLQEKRMKTHVLTNKQEAWKELMKYTLKTGEISFIKRKSKYKETIR